MNTWTLPFSSLALLITLTNQVLAQSRPMTDAIKTIGACVAVQTIATTVEMPLALRAEGSCEIAGDGASNNCTVEIVPTGPNTILDVNDRNVSPQCLKLAGDSPCDFVNSEPIIFQSQRRATQSFGSNQGRVRMTTTVRQKSVQQTTTDMPPTASFPLKAGRSFDVLKSRQSVAARLECSMADGDQRIFPIVGNSDLSPNIRFVSKNSSEPVFDILTYRVSP
jgi:hypothetical protein